jgi:hypothetical protein
MHKSLVYRYIKHVIIIKIGKIARYLIAWEPFVFHWKISTLYCFEIDFVTPHTSLAFFLLFYSKLEALLLFPCPVFLYWNLGIQIFIFDSRSVFTEAVGKSSGVQNKAADKCCSMCLHRLALLGITGLYIKSKLHTCGKHDSFMALLWGKTFHPLTSSESPSVV